MTVTRTRHDQSGTDSYHCGANQFRRAEYCCAIYVQNRWIKRACDIRSGMPEFVELAELPAARNDPDDYRCVNMANWEEREITIMAAPCCAAKVAKLAKGATWR